MGGILRIISPFLDEIKESGTGFYRAASPFKESSSSKRSFRINSETGHWNDYSSGLSGSLPTLLYRFGLTPQEVDRALEKSQFYEPLSAKALARKRLKEDYSTLPEWILRVYQHCPVSLLNLGFTEETLFYNDVGFDEPNERITFAIRDYRGRLVSVSGRATQEWQFPRYKVYDKKEFGAAFPGYVADNTRHLYGLHHFYGRRRTEPQGKSPLVIVEGYKAAMWVQQAGFKDVVALQGTWITREQAKWVSRLPGPYVVFLDNEPDKQIQDPDKDRPPAAVICAKRLRKAGASYLAQYPEGSEEGTAPDDLTPEEVAEAINNAVSPARLAIKKSRIIHGWRHP